MADNTVAMTARSSKNVETDLLPYFEYLLKKRDLIMPERTFFNSPFPFVTHGVNMYAYCTPQRRLVVYRNFQTRNRSFLMMCHTHTHTHRLFRFANPSWRQCRKSGTYLCGKPRVVNKLIHNRVFKSKRRPLRSANGI